MTRGKWIMVSVVLIGVGSFFLAKRRSPRQNPPPPVQSLAAAESEPTRDEAPAPVPSVKASPDVSQTFNHLQVIVQNNAGRPLEGAEVRASFKGEKGDTAITNLNATFTTAARGIAPVMWAARKIEQLELIVSMDDYAPRRVVWDLKTGDVIPPTYTVQLQGGIHVAGVVVDPGGNPLEGATVLLSRFWYGGEERKTKGEEPTFSRQKHITSADGRWAARNLPSELLERINVEGSHTNFIGVMVSMDRSPEVEQELRAGTHKLVLKRGLEARGRVVNEQEQPISGAQVWAGRKYSRDRQKTQSDAGGRFRFSNVNTGTMTFSVTAEGYAPDSKSSMVGVDSEEILFRLNGGATIRGVVQNEATEPIEGVRLSLAGSPGDPAYDHFEFSTTTGSDGRFEWTSAPREPMPFYVGKTGYLQRRGVRLKPNEENVVTLRLNAQVEGQVLDSETGQPVTRFRVAVGQMIRSPSVTNFSGDSSSAKEFNNDQGLFTIEVHEEGSNAIQASADDYAEQLQGLQRSESGTQQLVFKLKPSKGLRGVLIAPDGKPAVAAGVGLMEGGPGGRTLLFQKGRLRANGQAKVVTTDSSGRFSIPSPPENANVVAADGNAFASASVAEVRASGVLTLQAFGRIEGVLLVGSEAGPGQQLTLSWPGGGLSFQDYRATTDEGGRFAFENVTPGTVSLSRLVPTSARSSRYSHSQDVVVQAGQTTQVALGGVEATLRAQVRFEAELNEKNLTLSAQLDMPRPQSPPGLTPQERIAYNASPEWQELIKKRKTYSAAVRPDGSILIDSVEPGQYTLTVTAMKSDDDAFGAGRKPLAKGETTVIVPPGAQPGTPINVGEVVLKPGGMTK